MSILLKNVSLNGQKTDVFIEKNTFSKIAPNLNITADKVVNAANKAILPAFYNLHCHAAMSVLKGLNDDKELFAWLKEDIWPIEDKLTAEDIYTASKLAILEMIKSGTVFFSDMYFFVDKTAQAAAEMGIRAATGRVMADAFDVQKYAENQEKAQSFETVNLPENAIKTLSCHAVYTVSPELFKWSAAFAKEHHKILHIHVAETAKEVTDCIAKYGKTPVQMLEEWGVLENKCIFAHAVHLSDEDIAIVKKHDITLVANPVSNLKLVSGLFPLKKYMQNGLKIALGTDGASSNNNLSMLEEMKYLSMVAKTESQDPTAGKAADIFKIATQNGAEAFGFNAGVIQEGKLADFMLVNLNHHSLVPNHNLLSNMVYAATDECITDVCCNGKLIMENRAVAGEDEIIASAQRLAEKIKSYKA